MLHHSELQRVKFFCKGVFKSFEEIHLLSVLVQYHASTFSIQSLFLHTKIPIENLTKHLISLIHAGLASATFPAGQLSVHYHPCCPLYALMSSAVVNAYIYHQDDIREIFPTIQRPDAAFSVKGISEKARTHSWSERGSGECAPSRDRVPTDRALFPLAFPQDDLRHVGRAADGDLRQRRRAAVLPAGCRAGGNEDGPGLDLPPHPR